MGHYGLSKDFVARIATQVAGLAVLFILQQDVRRNSRY
jgi:hypothetical protein